ncbi:MAG: cytochrome b/b6 domain-containing protein [Chloroflexota bacterium]|jgi:cytochrome b subunit of formate dehydrogenase
MYLDKTHPPVARFRIVSSGLANIHALKVSEDISGTQACLTCGNCVDNCPVVASKPAGTMFVRTSMLLENVVAEDCRRRYKCIAACPQVDRPIKDYVRGFRRFERLSHWDILVSYLVLMTTGILINHWGNDLPGDLRDYLGVIHRIFTVGLIAGPLLLLLFDPHHFAMAAKKALSWSRKDFEWFKSALVWFRSLGKKGALHRGAFNPGQRFWYIYVPIVILLFAITGALKWLGPDVVGQDVVVAATTAHVVIAFSTDIRFNA